MKRGLGDMKKYLLVFASLFFIVGCNNSEVSEPEEKPEQTKQEVVEKSNVSISFSEVDVVINNNVIHITGEAKTTEDVFYYVLQQGDLILVEETEVKLDEIPDEWRVFESEGPIEETKIDEEENQIMKLYAKDKGRIINPSFIPIDVWAY